MPFVHLNLVATVFVGGVAGTVTGKLLVRGLVRNNLTAAVAGTAVGFIARLCSKGCSEKNTH